MLDTFRAPPSPFERPTIAHRIVSSPVRFIAQQIYSCHVYLRSPGGTNSSEDQSIRVLCISDTHCQKPTALPPAEVLVHAGDLTNQGTVAEIQDQLDWLDGLDYEHKVVIAGNHDSYFDPRSRNAHDKGKGLNFRSINYLQHSSITLKFPYKKGRELKLYGAPQLPQCGGSEHAFQYPRAIDAWRETIPEDVDVLVTHTPPQYHLDLPQGMGCAFLLKELWRVRPRLHVFGHVHLGYGQQDLYWDQAQMVYERLCARDQRSWRDFFAVWAWIDCIKLAFHSTLGLIWSTIWGGRDNKTHLVNAALMIGSTGRLGNLPQVVNI